MLRVTESVDITINNVDWELLQEQKFILLLLSANTQNHEKHRAAAAGVVNFIEYIQDQAVDAGVPETVVFGEFADE